METSSGMDHPSCQPREGWPPLTRISHRKNNRVCHKRYERGGRDHGNKDWSRSVPLSHADHTENACQLIICLYWKGAFIRRKEKRTLGIFHCLLGIMAVGKGGLSFLLARFLLSSSKKNENTRIGDTKNCIRKG